MLTVYNWIRSQPIRPNICRLRFISGQGWMQDYESGKPQRPYIQIMRDGSTQNKPHTLTHYVRDVQHHPENTNNTKYTDQELAQSIEDMRNYLVAKMAITDEWLCEDDDAEN